MQPIRIEFGDWQALDRQHYLHPFTDYKQIAARGTRVITRAEGVYIYDAEGRQLLDGMSGLWCVNVGYGRKELAEVAARQMHELPYYNSFFQCTTPPAIELATKLAELTPPQFNMCSSPARVRGQRHHRPPGAPLLGAAGPARAQDHHQPRRTATTAAPWPAPASAA